MPIPLGMARKRKDGRGSHLQKVICVIKVRALWEGERTTLPFILIPFKHLIAQSDEDVSNFRLKLIPGVLAGEGKRWGPSGSSHHSLWGWGGSGSIATMQDCVESAFKPACGTVSWEHLPMARLRGPCFKEQPLPTHEEASRCGDPVGAASLTNPQAILGNWSFPSGFPSRGPHLLFVGTFYNVLNILISPTMNGKHLLTVSLCSTVFSVTHKDVCAVGTIELTGRTWLH